MERGHADGVLRRGIGAPGEQPGGDLRRVALARAHERAVERLAARVRRERRPIRERVATRDDQLRVVLVASLRAHLGSG
jgi:hypothetical protein